MVRGHGTIKRDRDEQLQLRKQIANVYNVVRDLGLNYKMTEISGCSFITIGRTEHKFSHLDKNLTLTAPATREGEEHVEEINVTMGENRDSTSVSKETFQILQKAYMEKEKEANRLNLQLANLSSQLQVINNEGRSLHRTSLEQNEEIKRLTAQLSSPSSSPQAIDCLAKKEAEIKLDLERTIQNQKMEINRLTSQLSELSLLLQDEAKKKEMSYSDALNQEDQNRTLDQLTKQLEACKASKIRAESSSQNYKNDFESLESEKRQDDLKLVRYENTISELTKSLEKTENKLSRIMEESSDKDDKIKVISDQNKTLTRERSKILAKLEWQQEEYQLQFDIQRNLTYQSGSHQVVKTLSRTIREQEAEIRKLSYQLSGLCSTCQKSAEKKEAVVLINSAEIPVKQQLPDDNPSESKDCTEAAEDLKEDESTTDSLADHPLVDIIHDWVQAFRNSSADIRTAIMDFFETAYSDDFFLDSRDRGDYSKAVAELMMSNEGLNILTAIVREIASEAKIEDKLQLEPNYTTLVECLRRDIKDSLPRLMKDLHDDSVSYDPIATLNKSEALDNQLERELIEIIGGFLDKLETEAYKAAGVYDQVWHSGIPDSDNPESDDDPDISSSESDGNPEAELNPLTQLTSLTSTPHKLLCDKDEEKDRNLKENASDSGMGTSGYLDTSDPFRTSEGKLLEIFSSLSNLYGEPNPHELENQSDSEEGTSSTDLEI
jgi:hypothetical protein